MPLRPRAGKKLDIADRFRLDVPVGQAGMGGGLAGGALAGAVAKAGGLGTLGLAQPHQLRTGIGRVRTEAPGRAVAVNLLMHFTRRSHVAVCVDQRVEVVVVAFGGDRDIVEHLRDAGIFVFVMVGSETQARRAIDWGADGLIAQGREAGGHLVGTMQALDFLPLARAAAGQRPVFLAGGIATRADTRAALDAGADGVIAGTRFLMTHEANAHPEYQRRILDAETTLETTLFGISWSLRHRVIPNAATRRWCRSDGTAKTLPAAINASSRWLAVLGYLDAGALMRVQSPRLPAFTPLAPLAGMPASSVDRGALYAGDTALRINEIVSAQQAVNDLAP
jgi:nitronate monooxygenase